DGRARARAVVELGEHPRRVAGGLGLEEREDILALDVLDREEAGEESADHEEDDDPRADQEDLQSPGHAGRLAALQSLSSRNRLTDASWWSSCSASARAWIAVRSRKSSRQRWGSSGSG